MNALAWLVLFLFSITLFTSALLLFVLEPMVGKIVLPLFGGTPAVWSTCMVFYQAVLLAGYAYAHACSAWLTRRTQALLHLGVLLVPLLFLPLTVNARFLPGQTDNPVPALLLLLATLAGLPLFAVCTSAPLLQRWFAGTAHPLARDPYFLYGASNFGSMMALLAYPTLIEPLSRLEDQKTAWAAGYVLLIVLTGGCGVFLLRSARAGAGAPAQRDEHDRPAEDTAAAPARAAAVTWRRRLRWVLLALVPSSLMLGVTTYLTTDVAAIPLLWVLPLALYLLSFIIVFARISPDLLHRAVVRALPLLVLLLLFLMLSGSKPELFGSAVATGLVLHLLTLFVAALACHGELARDRPPARNLTEYYLWMSAGGVLGGLFNGLVAPLAFRTLIEYPLVLAATCLLLPRPQPRNDLSWRTRAGLGWLDLVLPLGIALLTLGLLYGLRSPTLEPTLKALASRFDVSRGSVFYMLAFGLPALACCAFLGRPLRLGLAAVALLLAGALHDSLRPNVLFQGRSFFGTLEVRGGQMHDGDRELPFHALDHGSTLHGRQFTDAERRGEPLTYYHRTGPLGQVFAAYNTDGRRSIGVVGLGTGTIAAYAHPGQRLTFYEIDPLVRDLCFNDSRYFSYVDDARRRGVDIDLIMGDARLRLARQRLDETRKYGLLVIDAFSSDAIPVHLLTREALRDVYLEQLGEHGLLLFHITNRYLDLRPVLANLAQNAGLVGLCRHDEDTSPPGKNRSIWVVLARREEDLELLRKSESARDREGEKGERACWRPLQPDRRVGLWTDDYAPLLRVFSW